MMTRAVRITFPSREERDRFQEALGPSCDEISTCSMYSYTFSEYVLSSSELARRIVGFMMDVQSSFDFTISIECSEC
jgi:hypothetical protein